MDVVTTSSARQTSEDWRSLVDHGEAVDCSARRISLHQQNAIWLVTDGTFDLFAVDASGGGRWSHIGRLLPGAILLAPVAGPRHSLLVRPSAGAGLHRLSVKSLAKRAQASTPQAPGKVLQPWERALTDGIDAGLTVLMNFLRGDLPPQDFVPLVSGREAVLAAGQNARPVGGVLWVDVLQGELKVSGPTGLLDHHAGDSMTLGQHDWITSHSPARVKAHDTRDVYRSGQLWRRVLELENRSLYLLDRAIERRERRRVQRLGASRDASRTAEERADLALGGVLQTLKRGTSWRSAGGEDPTTAACRAVAEAMHIDHFPNEGPPIHTQAGPIEQVAMRARLRTRTIRLDGAWWRTNVGPFVGHRTSDFGPLAFIWSRGHYRAWDPVSGRTTVVNERTAADYETRAVMFYKPLPEHAVRIATLLRSGFRGAAGDVRTMVVGALVVAVLGALVPVFTGTVLGTLVPAARTSLIIQICVALLLTGVAATAFGVMENIALLRLEGRFETSVQTAVWDRLLRLPANFFKSYSTAELASAALGASDLNPVLMGVSSAVLFCSAAALVNLVVLFAISVPFALLGVGLAVGSIVVFLVLGSRQIKWQAESRQLDFQLTNKVFQKLRGLPKLRVAAAEERAYADWAGTFSRQKDVQKRIGRYQNGIVVFNAAYLQFCLLVVFLVESSTGIGVPVAKFLTFLAALVLMLSSITQLTMTISSAITVVPIFERMKPILQHSPESSTASTDPGELSGHIEVSHLTFGYTKDAPPVFSDVSFRVQPGEFLAIVGPSGGGKSTLLRMLLGFETPDTGTVLYDGQDLSSLDKAAVRRQCGVVLQHSKPFNGSIFQAITGAMNYSMAEAWEAAELAGLSEEIAAMPMGMHTLITDESTLSGGQRQRLVIARALIRRPRILLFDEATSALDNRTQRIVTEATQRLHATRIVIAHRLSTVMEADKILVLSQGKVIQYGSPASLLADGDGMFHQLVHRQMQ